MSTFPALIRHMLKEHPQSCTQPACLARFNMHIHRHLRSGNGDMKRFFARRRILVMIDWGIVLGFFALVIGTALYWAWLGATESSFAAM